jgi:beta-glucosidase
MKFLWGVATSSHQIEGGNSANDWWAWELAGNIESGEVSGSATDHRNRFEEDLRNAASLGLNTYRFSIEWSRLEPFEGHWDQEAFDWYGRIISLCEQLGLMPMVTLHHFTLPKWLADKGGVTYEHFADRFKGYVRKVALTFGSRVPLWCTVNEPMLLVIGAYMGAIMPPARSNPKQVAAGHRGMLKAHVVAYDTLHKTITHREGPWKDVPLQVGFAHNMIDFQPLHRFSVREWLMAKVFHRYYNMAWLRAVTGRRQNFGVWFVLPKPRQVWAARGRKTVDFIGINYYMKAYPCWGPQKEEGAQFVQFHNLPLGIRFSRAQDKVSDLGWPIHPRGLGKMIRLVARFGLPIYVTENGVADSRDQFRAQFIQDHVSEIARARSRGADVRGYYHWSLLDNFEWIKGFGPRFGLWAVDYSTKERTPRASTQVYAQIVKRGDPAPDRDVSF